MKRLLTPLLLAIYLCASSGCGVLLYPERQGQKQGKLDVGVVALDGIGLFFFVVPGLIAFAIDFYQGTIYLPNTGFSDIESMKNNSQSIKVDGPINKASIEQAIFEATGKKVDIADGQVQIFDIQQKQALSAEQIAQNQFLQSTVKLWWIWVNKAMLPPLRFLFRIAMP